MKTTSLSSEELARVREQQKEHQAGLRSAKIVQEGLLPKSRHLSRVFNNHFVLYRPQRIISGDFFWVGEKHNLKYLVVGDCNGHGISAALLSVLMLNLLEYTIMNKGIKKTHKILQEVDKKFIESFKNNSAQSFDTPWVDLSIICIDTKENKLYYSTANRKILFIDSNQNTTTLYQGSKYPIGGWKIESNRTFTSRSINYSPGDSLYLGSDGFQDQLGGEKTKRFQSKNLHQFIENNNHLTFERQLESLENELDNWQQNQQQTDDICLVGVQL